MKTMVEAITLLSSKFPYGGRRATETQLKLLEILPAGEMISIEGIQSLYRETYPNDFCPSVQGVACNMGILRRCGLVERHPIKTGKVFHIQYEYHDWTPRPDGWYDHTVIPKTKDIEEVKIYFKRV